MRFPAFFSPLPQQYAVERYSVALAAAALSILLRAIVEPVLGHTGFYVTIYLAVVFSALVCGVWPSIITAIIGMGGVVYWFVDPRRTFLIADPRDIHGLITCFVACAVLIALGETNRTKQLRLNRAHDELELRVAERTGELSQALAKLESEIAVRSEVEQELRRLSLHLMTIQDEERRRIARDLHDSAGQTLAAIKMSLAMLQQSERVGPSAGGLGLENDKREKLFNDLNALADEALKEIRTTSYLLHPPLLDEAGFASAARWFAQGFTKRSGIQIHCDLPQGEERLPKPLELALFRVLQESLTNVHRHSRATEATIKFTRCNNEFELEVRDNGCGLSPEQLRNFRESAGGSGVGIAGMRERICSLGGRLMVQSNGTGTSIKVALPVAPLANREAEPAISVA